MKQKPYAFFFHYNKPLSKQTGSPVISVHTRGACSMVGNVDCRVPVKGRIGKRQPYFVMAGKGVVTVRVTDDQLTTVAVIT